MQTDPVCRMQVDPGSAAGALEHEGVRYFFCSQHCLAKFKADPGKYLRAASPAAGHGAGHQHRG